MRGFLALVAGVAAIGFAPVASAQWYVSGNAGAVMVQDSDVEISGPGGSLPAEVEFDTGFGITGAIGRVFGSWRVEGEVGYRGNDLDQGTIPAVTIGGVAFPAMTGDVEGEISALSFMANVWYDFNIGGSLVPFVGGGIGIAKLDLDLDAVNFSESDTVFAYQFGGGVGYKVNPNILVNVQYRYFGTTDPEFENGGATVEAEYGSHNIMGGVTFLF